MELMSSTYAEWLNRQITARGWSLRATARKLGVSHTTVIRVANGEVAPSADLATKTAALFAIPAQEVFSLAGILPPTGARSEGVKALEDRLEAMPEVLRAETLALINAVLDYRQMVTAPVDEASERVSLFERLVATLPEDEQDALIAELQARVGQLDGDPSSDG